jgi:hypothetical protein
MQTYSSLHEQVVQQVYAKKAGLMLPSENTLDFKPRALMQQWMGSRNHLKAKSWSPKHTHLKTSTTQQGDLSLICPVAAH